MATKKTKQAGVTKKATKAKAATSGKGHAAERQDKTGAPSATPVATASEPTNAEKIGALDAAFKVLGETGGSMTTKELIGVMAARGYWTSPNGQTPQATLYAAILREIQAKAGASRFVKVGRGTFGLRTTT